MKRQTLNQLTKNLTIYWLVLLKRSVNNPSIPRQRPNLLVLFAVWISTHFIIKVHFSFYFLVLCSCKDHCDSWLISCCFLITFVLPFNISTYTQLFSICMPSDRARTHLQILLSDTPNIHDRTKKNSLNLFFKFSHTFFLCIKVFRCHGHHLLSHSQPNIRYIFNKIANFKSNKWDYSVLFWLFIEFWVYFYWNFIGLMTNFIPDVY